MHCANCINRCTLPVHIFGGLPAVAARLTLEVAPQAWMCRVQPCIALWVGSVAGWVTASAYGQVFVLCQGVHSYGGHFVVVTQLCATGHVFGLVHTGPSAGLGV
jgi:hypothetical protein